MDKDEVLEKKLGGLEAENERLLAAAEANGQEAVMWRDLAQQSIRALAELKAASALAPAELPKKSAASP